MQETLSNMQQLQSARTQQMDLSGILCPLW